MCVDRYGNQLDGKYCSSQEKPIEKERCIASCGIWRYNEWSEVSKIIRKLKLFHTCLFTID